MGRMDIMSETEVKVSVRWLVGPLVPRESWWVDIEFEPAGFHPEDRELCTPAVSTREEAKSEAIRLLKQAIKQIEGME